MSRRKHRRRRPRPKDLAASIAAAARHEGRPTTLRLVGCDGQTTEEVTVGQPQDLLAARQRWPVIWVDVEGFEDLPANAVMVVKGERERWVPTSREHLREIDDAAKTILVDWPADL